MFRLELVSILPAITAFELLLGDGDEEGRLSYEFLVYIRAVLARDFLPLSSCLNFRNRFSNTGIYLDSSSTYKFTIELKKSKDNINNGNRKIYLLFFLLIDLN